VINRYNSINKAKNQSLNIFDNNESHSISKKKNSYFSNLITNINNKSNSVFSTINNDITNNILLNTFNSNIRTINYNNINSNTNVTSNLGASHFSQQPYCINIINENEISRLESSKNNLILADKNEKEDSNKDIRTNIHSQKSNNNLTLTNNDHNNINNNLNNINCLNDKFIIKNLNSRNLEISNFESIDNTNKTNTHSRNTVKKFHNCILSKDSDYNTRSIALINDESTNFFNINSKGSQFNTLDSGNNLLLINKNSGISKTNSRTNSNNNGNSNSKPIGNSKHHKSLSKVVLFNKKSSMINISNNNNNNSSNKKEKSRTKNFSYGILFKEFDNKLNKELKEMNIEADGTKTHKSPKSSSIGKQGKDINMNIELNKIKEEIKEKKIPKFKNQFKLNKYLIRDFKIGEVTNAKQSSKNHIRMTEDFANYQETKRSNYGQQRNSCKQESMNPFSADVKSLSPQKKGFEENEKNANNNFEYKIKSQLYELEMEKRDLDQRLKVR
jgi:hypothetical protein